MKEIVVTKISPSHYSVSYGENNTIGEFIQDVDGYFYFIPDNNYGLWASYSLRMIADKLDEINKPWNEQIDKYFKQQRENIIQIEEK